MTDLVGLALVFFAVFGVGLSAGAGLVLWAIGWDVVGAALRGDDPEPDPPDEAEPPLRLVWSSFDAPAVRPRALTSREGPAA